MFRSIRLMVNPQQKEGEGNLLRKVILVNQQRVRMMMP
jgi:hypothetical protein